jgi:hypothetical protein
MADRAVRRRQRDRDGDWVPDRSPSPPSKRAAPRRAAADARPQRDQDVRAGSAGPEAVAAAAQLGQAAGLGEADAGGGAERDASHDGAGPGPSSARCGEGGRGGGGGKTCWCVG